MESDESATLDLTEGKELGGENSAFSGEMADAEGSACQEASPEPEAISAKANDGQGAASGSAEDVVLDVLESPTATCSGEATNAKGSVLGALVDSSEQPLSPPVEAMAATGSSNNGKSSTDAKDAMPSSSSAGRPLTRSRRRPLGTHHSSRVHSSSEPMLDRVRNIIAQRVDERGIKGFEMRGAHYYLARLPEIKGAIIPSSSASSGSVLPSAPATGPPKEPGESGSGPLSLRTILGASLACAAVSCVLFFFFDQSKESSVQKK